MSNGRRGGWDHHLSMIARNLNKDVFRHRTRTETFREDDAMWTWIASFDSTKTRVRGGCLSRTGEGASFEVLTAFAKIRREIDDEVIFVMKKGWLLGEGGERGRRRDVRKHVRVRACKDLGWYPVRSDPFSNVSEHLLLWSHKSMLSDPDTIIIDHISVKRPNVLRRMLERSVQERIEIETRFVESGRMDDVRDATHVQSDSLDEKTIRASPRWHAEAMTLNACCALVILHSLRRSFQGRQQKHPPSREDDAVVDFETLVRSSAHAWRDVETSAPDVIRERDAHERLVAMWSPSSVRNVLESASIKWDSDDDKRTLIMELMRTVPFLHVTSSAALARCRGRYEWFANLAASRLIQNDSRDDSRTSREGAVVSHTKSKRRRKKQRMKMKQRHRRTVSMVSDLVSEIVNDAMRRSEWLARKRRAEVERERQRALFRKKETYIEMRSLVVSIGRTAACIGERHAATRLRVCRDAARVSGRAATDATRAATYVRRTLAAWIAAKIAHLAARDASKALTRMIVVKEDETASVARSSESATPWASSQCNSIYEMQRSKRGYRIRAVGTSNNKRMRNLPVDTKIVPHQRGGNASDQRTQRDRVSRSDEDDVDDDDVTWLLHEDILDMTASFDRIAKQRRPFQLAVVNAVRAVVTRLWPVRLSASLSLSMSPLDHSRQSPTFVWNSPTRIILRVVE